MRLYLFFGDYVGEKGVKIRVRVRVQIDRGQIDTGGGR